MKRAILLGVALCALAGVAQAQQFPTRPVTLIVPWPANGAADISLRALASATEKHLGQPIAIENKPGRSGTLGPADMAANAKPDGYTVSQVTGTVFRLPFVQKASFDPATDFTYIVQVTGYTYGVVVRAEAPWTSFRELLDYARTHPGKLEYGTAGAGTLLHITMEQIAKREGVRWTHIALKGAAETTEALLDRRVQAVAASSGWAPQVNAGTFRLLVTWGGARTKNWPQVPTLKEVGIDMVSNAPFGIAGPKGMDPAVVKILHDAFRKGMQEQSFKDTMAKLDQEDLYLGTADYHAYAMKQIGEQKQLVEELGLKQR